MEDCELAKERDLPKGDGLLRKVGCCALPLSHDSICDPQCLKWHLVPWPLMPAQALDQALLQRNVCHWGNSSVSYSCLLCILKSPTAMMNQKGWNLLYKCLLEVYPLQQHWVHNLCNHLFSHQELVCILLFRANN